MGHPYLAIHNVPNLHSNNDRRGQHSPSSQTDDRTHQCGKRDPYPGSQIAPPAQIWICNNVYESCTTVSEQVIQSYAIQLGQGLALQGRSSEDNEERRRVVGTDVWYVHCGNRSMVCALLEQEYGMCIVGTVNRASRSAALRHTRCSHLSVQLQAVTFATREL